MKDMLAAGLDPADQNDRIKFAREVLMTYYRRTTEAAKYNDPDMPIYHNSHIPKGDREIFPYFSHFELESLPTGGWGYDHYPLAAAYCRSLDKEFLGMTGKFHTSWGEFGGFKHPNALRYECAAMLAQGSKCSVGDQLHPSGALDESTYRIIGSAYREVAQKEAWCENVRSAAGIAILGQEVLDPKYRQSSYGGDEGAARLLLELHQPFDYVDAEMDFSRYSMLIMPDSCRVDDQLAEKLQKFLADGGKLVLSGESGMKPGENTFRFDIGAEYSGKSEFQPDYLRSAPEFSAEYMSTPQVMYLGSQRIKPLPGSIVLGDVFDPYFNRRFDHFCSHRHTPYRPEPSGFASGVMTENILYFAHPVFSLYRTYGNTAVKSYVAKALEKFAGETWQVRSDMPPQGRITIMEQPELNRTIVHLLYANTILRGGSRQVFDGTVTGGNFEVIEELNPAPAFHLSLRFPGEVRKITAVPENIDIPFTRQGDRLEIDIESFTCHRMLELS
jgi:hypothetical protein